MPFNHLILYHPLLLLPSIFLSIGVFSNELVLQIRWPKDWNFSFSISPSSEYSGLISFRIDCFDLLAVLGALKSLIQHHSLKASILQTIILTRQIFVGKVILKEMGNLKRCLNNFIDLFLAVLDLRCFMGFFLVAKSGGRSPVAVLMLLIVVASLV